MVADTILEARAAAKKSSDLTRTEVEKAETQEPAVESTNSTQGKEE